MNLKDLLTAPRYGIYLPKDQVTTDLEYTGYGSSFRISTSLTLGDDDTFVKVKETLDDYLEQSNAYFEANDLALLGVLLSAGGTVASELIDFSKDGITLARLITVNAKRIEFIYEKYNHFEYALQLSLTQQSSIKFAWSDSKLSGDFYFNIKRSFGEDVTAITGYTFFHLGNAAGAKPVTLRAGMVKRKPLKKQDDEEPTPDKGPQQKEDYVYIQLQSRSYEGITIADIGRMITPDTEGKMPEWLEKVAIHDFVVLRKKTTDGDIKTNTLAIVLDCEIDINEQPLKTKLTIFSETTNGKTSFGFEGVVTLDGHRFSLKIKKGDKHWAIIATYDSGQRAKEINFKELVGQLFGEDAKNIAPDIRINIKDFKAFFYYDKSESGSKILLGMGASIDIDLKSLPIAGQILVEANAIAFKDVLVIYAKGAFSEAELKEIKALGKGYQYRQGLSVCATVVANGESTYYTLGGSDPAPQLLDTAESQGSKADEVASKVSWSKVDKKIGPVHLQRIGLAYNEGKIIALLDASIASKALEMQLMGLGVGFNLDWNDLSPKFYLDGLGLSYRTDSVEISGALMRTQQNGTEVYNGQARLKMKNFTLSALGSYAKTEAGASLFIYGLYEGNIGGPPIFYVTGIAAGFGYNRKINAPDIDEVAQFPLVALAMQPQDKGLRQVLDSLEQPLKSGKLPIEIAIGNYWLAVGVKFTSFKLIETFVLVTVNLGPKTEFNILGLSRMSWPEASIRKKINLAEPLVFVEIAIKVSFGSDSDVIAVDGLITPSSYVFSRNCQLSGGFAFYTWVSGPHAGDFVLSIGGYHPRFPKPAHYPVVPRVALHWQLTKNLFIRGELYFALTPSAMMMGGRWELAYVSDNVKASFLLWIDILMQWAPLYYDISIGILIRVDAHIKLKLITVHLHLELRASLDIWGPPFSGKAEIDLGIFSFEIGFGSKTLPERKPMLWDEFAGGFLPKDKATEQQEHLKRVPGLGSSGVRVDCINASLTKGVINCIEEKGKAPLNIANPQQMELVIDSGIPVGRLQFNGQPSGLQNEDDTMKMLGVRPCGFTSDEVSFEMEVEVKLGGKVVDNFEKEEVRKGFPDALWGGSAAPEGNDPKTQKDPEAPKVIQNVMSGLKLKAIAPDPEKSKFFDFSTIVQPYTPAPVAMALPNIGGEEVFYTRDVYQKMQEYGQIQKTDVRNELMAMGFGEEDMMETTIHEHIYSQGGNYFRATPKIGSIGHNYHNPDDTQK